MLQTGNTHGHRLEEVVMHNGKEGSFVIRMLACLCMHNFGRYR